MIIVINGMRWRLYFTSDTSKLLTSQNVVALGVTDVKEKAIYIYARLNEQMLRKVLMHELTHAWIFSYGYYLTLEEEEFVCSFVDSYAEDILYEADKVISDAVRKSVVY